MSVVIIILVLLFSPWEVLADTGDDLIVTGSLVNVRSGPSLEHPVIMRLEKGQRLTEVRREGSWVNIETYHADSTTAWVHAKLVAAAPEPMAHKDHESTEEEALFDLFLRAFEEMNENIRMKTGNIYFLNAENLGHGEVEITATAAWLNAPEQEKDRDLAEVFRIWDAAMVHRSQVSVFIVDEDGNRLMSMFR